MGKLKDEFLDLKNRKDDITDRLDKWIKDPTKKTLNSSYGGLLYEDLIPLGTKNERGRVLATLLESKANKLPSTDTNKEILGYLSKVIKRKLAVKSLPSKLALGAIEQLLLSSYISTNQKEKQLIYNKAKNLMGLATSIKETIEIEESLTNNPLNINEYLKMDVPTRFEDTEGFELAKTLTDKVNMILGLPEKEQLKQFTNLERKIIDTMETEKEAVETHDFVVLHHFRNVIGSKIHNLNEV